MESSFSAVAVPVSFSLLFLLVIALGLLWALGRAIRIKAVPVRDLSELEDSAHRVDVEAFRNLVDVGEEQYLRENLDGGEFRRIQRERMKAAVDYVRRTAQNASAVLSLGEAVRLQSDPQSVEAGRKLLDCAANLRMKAAIALLLLRFRIIFPEIRLSLGQVIDGYERFTTAAQRLTQLQAATSRPVSAAI